MLHPRSVQAGALPQALASGFARNALVAPSGSVPACCVDHDQAVERGLTPEEFEGARCHGIVHDVQAMCVDDENRIFPGSQSVNDCASAEERFHAPSVDRIRALKLDNKIPCNDAFDLQDVDTPESPVLLLQERL